MAYYLTNMSRRRIIASQPNEITREGSIVTFGTNLVRPMLVTSTITPVQDLSGGAPYPPGGGKNLLDDSGLLRGYYNTTGAYTSNGNYISYILNLKAGTYTFSTDLENCFISRYLIDDVQTPASVTTQKITFTLNADGEFKITIRNTSTSDISSITPHSQIESGQTATPYSPYSHICPITGWTGAEVTGAGVNLYNPDLMAKDYVNANAQRPCVKFTKQGTYYIKSLKTGESSGLTYLTVKNADGTYGTEQAVVNGTTVNNRTVTITDGQTLIVYGGASSSTTVDTVKGQFADWGIIVSPQDMTTYSAYSGTTLSVDWEDEAGTVYGCNLTINKDGTGTLAVTSQKLVYDGSDDEGWTKNGANGYTSALTGYTGTPICNYLKGLEPGSSGGLTTWSARLSTALTYFMAKPDVSVYDTAAKWKTYLSENNLEAVVSLAVPVTYTLTSQQVGQLLSKQGQNNVWADTGNVEVKAWGF